MLQGNPLNNFVTLEGKIRIIIDNKIESIHEGNLIEWRHKKFLRVKTNIHNKSSTSRPTKEKVLSLKARDEGVTKNHEPFLHLFYYQDEKFTDKEIKKQVLHIRQQIQNN
ncbi:MAG: hypothetical protein ACRBB2_00355 [Nitrosopumilus sp.]